VNYLLKYTLQRVLLGVLTLWLIVSATFFLLQFMPGSPFNDEKLDAEKLAILNEKYGLNDPLPVQYARYMGRVIQGDFGVSFVFDNQDVYEKLILPRLPVTAQVGGQALVFGAIIGIIFGSLAALNRNNPLDQIIVVTAILGVSIPSFVFAMTLQYFLGVKLGWFPVVFVKGKWISSVMPSFIMSLWVISSLTRYMRTELVEVLASDFILLARAKGLTGSQVIYRHAIRNALIPVITVIGPLTISLLTGSTVIEQIFGIPGVSFLMVQGIMQNDYFIILGVATFYSLLFISVILITDLMYGVIDPRIRLAGGSE